LRSYFLFIVAILAFSGLTFDVEAQSGLSPPPDPGFEIVKSHLDFEVSADGSYLESSETAFRVLDARGLKGLQQTTLTYTQGYEDLKVGYAYTLKANGQRVDVPQSSMLFGHGATSAPGFQDERTLTVIFPNVEIGDEVVLIMLRRQIVPWFVGQFTADIAFSRAIATHDAEISMTSPANGFQLNIDAKGMQGGDPEIFGDKIRRTWRYNNDVPITLEPDAIDEAEDDPHLVVSSFSGYDTVASAYVDRFRDKAAVTPEVQSLADSLTQGIADRREQARILYEWVSSRIAYVAIVLGAGGYTPHAAAQVLATKYGDCKDHVMLLQALLTAKGIDSSPVLINALRTYKISGVASPFVFNHLITYIPEFHLFADSTAQFVSFGSLPFSDAGKPVVLVASGKSTTTPVTNATESAVHVTGTVKLAQDGSYDGDTQIVATGAIAAELRGLMDSLPADGDGTYLRQVLGPGADGTFVRGDPKSLTPTYSFSTHYRLASSVNFPGPGALPPRLGFVPFSFSQLIAGNLPPIRSTSFACASFAATNVLKIELPPGVTILSLPKAADLQADGFALSEIYTQADKNTVVEKTELRMEHPEEFCTADYYTRVRPELAKMVNALRAQILYQ
jgi:transglutaminase-like putative cysteine protease